MFKAGLCLMHFEKIVVTSQIPSRCASYRLLPPIQTAMSVGWNPTFPDVKVGSSEWVESDQISTTAKHQDMSRQIHFEESFHANLNKTLPTGKD